MDKLEKDLLNKVLRQIGTRTSMDPLAFEARVWRAVAAHAPSLGAEQTAELSQRIVRAYRKTFKGMAGRTQPQAA